MKHGVRATFRPGRKRKAVVYRIPCGCDEAVYVVETYRQFETRKKEHERKVRLTRQDIEKGRLDSAENGGKEILNNYEQLTVWQTVLNSYFKWEVTEKRGLCVRTEITRDLPITRQFVHANIQKRR